MDWEKIAVAALMVGVIIYIYPRMHRSMKNAPKGKTKDWMGLLMVIGVVVLFVLFLSVTNLYAWGSLGHRIVAEIAMNNLSLVANQNIKQLIGHTNLAFVSNWADEIKRDKKWYESYSWHFVNVSTGKLYKNSIKSPSGDIIMTIKDQVKVLANKKTKKDDKKNAIKFLVHLVADIHHPLHNGYAKDRGGNEIKINWMGRKTNLHYIWDYNIIESQKLSYTEYASFLNLEYGKTKDKFKNDSLMTWHKESRDYLVKLYSFKQSKVWEKQYIHQHIGFINLRLYQAGIRLASLLNDIFERKPLKDKVGI